MILRVVNKYNLTNYSSIMEDLAYWQKKDPNERVAAVDFLRRQYHGGSIRLQRSARIIQQTQS